MKPRFPLFRLPNSAIIEVIKNFPLRQLFAFSLVSTKTKDLVSSLGIKTSKLDICVYNLLHVSMISGESYLGLNFYDESKYRNGLSPIDITLPVDVCFEYKGSRMQALIPFNFSDWMNYIRTIFCFTKPPNISFYGSCEKYGIELLKDTIGNVNVLFVSHLVTDVMSRTILKHFNTPNKLFLCKNPFEEACQIQQTFVQNFETIEFDDVHSLDDMLLVNGKKVYFYHATTQKQFNQFLQHWIRGSNPRLQFMFLLINKIDVASEAMYLNGIRCMEMSEDAKTEIRQKHKLPIEVDMIKIKRKDGTSAVIGTNKSDNIIYFHFIVLH
ncbi:hypothetical protein CRE_23065 [Caenorhabditis remanei]|uniref:F-box domain-containing protein n=1 Tax=Caenorhabditis remanei TaxID=31234 RepID=E3N9H1_CAERE|nr:hypothetical protein CRE_23065 [Caenorhabditis remanei]